MEEKKEAHADCEWCMSIRAALGPHSYDCAAIQREGPRLDSACDCDARDEEPSS